MNNQNITPNTLDFKSLRTKVSKLNALMAKKLTMHDELYKFQQFIIDQVFYVRVTDEVYKNLTTDLLDFMEFKMAIDPEAIELSTLYHGERFINCYLTEEAASKDLPEGYKIVKSTFLTLEYFFSIDEARDYKFNGIIFEPASNQLCMLDDITILLLSLTSGIRGYVDPEDLDEEVEPETIEEVRSLFKEVLKDTNPDSVLNFYDAIRNFTVYIPANDCLAKDSVEGTHLDLDYVLSHDLIDFSCVLPGANGGFALGVFSSLEVAKDCGPTDGDYYSIRFKDYVKGFMKWYKDDMKLEGVCIDPLIGDDMMYVCSANMKLFKELEDECYDVYEPER